MVVADPISAVSLAVKRKTYTPGTLMVANAVVQVELLIETVAGPLASVHDCVSTRPAGRVSSVTVPMRFTDRLWSDNSENYRVLPG